MLETDKQLLSLVAIPVDPLLHSSYSIVRKPDVDLMLRLANRENPFLGLATRGAPMLMLFPIPLGVLYYQ